MVIDNIQNLKLRDFIQCACYDNYSVLGDGSEDELKNAWIKILSQYYDISEKKDVINYLNKVLDINTINYYSMLIKAISDRLDIFYDASAANLLKSNFPNYEFSKESYKDDLKHLEASRIPDIVRRDISIKEIEKDQEKQNKIALPEQRHKNLIHMLFNINKAEGVAYNLDMSVFEFAVGEARFDMYLKSLQRNGR